MTDQKELNFSNENLGEDTKGLNDISKQESLVKDVKNTLLNMVEGTEKTLCPFLEWKEYVEIRETLSPEDQKKMQENIGKKDQQGKIEIIKMKSKFSILMSEAIDNENIFSGDYIDVEGKIGMPGMIYLTGDSAEKEIEKQGKNILTDTVEVDYFFSLFPGKNIEEKISNFVKLFGLKKTGFFSKLRNKWYNVGSIGYVRLSKQEWSENHTEEGKVSHKDLVREVQFGDHPHIRSLGKQEYPMVYVVKESI